MRKVSIAALQMVSTPSVEENLDSASRLIAEAAQQGAQLGFEDRNPHARVHHIDFCTVVEPPAFASIDELIGRAAAVQNIAVGGEGFRGQRRGGNGAAHRRGPPKSREA